MDNLPNRKRLRLKDYDYSQNGCYFVTICTKDRQPLFWKSAVADNIRPNLSEYGKIADTAINAVPLHYPNMKIDKYVIMPDHIHLILTISNILENRRGGYYPPDDEKILQENGIRRADDTQRADNIRPYGKTIMTVIGQMKRWVSKEIGFSIWQKSYYEHIIRNEDDYIETVKYILNNPLKWELTKTNLQNDAWRND